MSESLAMESLVAGPSPTSLLERLSWGLLSSSSTTGAGAGQLRHSLVVRDREDRARKRFRKMVKLFGVNRLGGDEVDTSAAALLDSSELLATATLKTVIGRLHDGSNPLNLLDSNGKEEKERLYKALDEIDSNLESPGFMTFQEYSQLLGDPEASSAESTIGSYLQQLERGKALFKWPPPCFTLGLTLIQVVFFLLSLQFVLLTPALHFDTSLHSEVWRYLTYSLVHLDLPHLASNLCLQLAVGGLMEMRHGPRRVALLYLLGVASSSLAYYCFDCNVLLGTSGGVYCLVVSCICTTVLNWREDEVFFLARFRAGKAPIACGGKLIRILKLTIIATFVGLDFGLALRRRLVSEDIGVSVVAHSSGSLAGFLAGFSVLKDEQKDPWEQLWKLVCLSLFLLLLLAALVVNITGYRGAVGVFGFM